MNFRLTADRANDCALCTSEVLQDLSHVVRFVCPSLHSLCHPSPDLLVGGGSRLGRGTSADVMDDSNGDRWSASCICVSVGHRLE